MNAQRRHLGKRARIAIIAAALILIPAIAVAAATIYSSFSKLLEDVEPELSEYLEPVEMSCESSGIRVELVSYAYDNNNLLAYINLEDTEGLGRVGEEDFVVTSLFHADTTPTDSGAMGFSLETYDEETGIATYKMDLSADLTGISNYTVSLDKLYYGTVTHSALDTGIDLSEYIDKKPEVEDIWNGSARDIVGNEKGLSIEKPITVIALDAMNLSVSDFSYIKITNMGFYDGKFHVQVCYDSTANVFVDAYLKDNNGNRLNSSLALSFSEDKEVWNGLWYVDYAFDVSEENIGDYSLLMDGTEYVCVEGTWDINIPMNDKSLNMRTVDCSITLGNCEIQHIIISHFGVTAYGIDYSGESGSSVLYYGGSNNSAYNMTLNCGDETIVLTLNSRTGDRMTWSYGDTWGTGYNKVDIDSIDSITLGDYVVDLN